MLSLLVLLACAKHETGGAAGPGWVRTAPDPADVREFPGHPIPSDVNPLLIVGVAPDPAVALVPTLTTRARASFSGSARCDADLLVNPDGSVARVTFAPAGCAEPLRDLLADDLATWRYPAIESGEPVGERTRHASWTFEVSFSAVGTRTEPALASDPYVVVSFPESPIPKDVDLGVLGTDVGAPTQTVPWTLSGNALLLGTKALRCKATLLVNPDGTVGRATFLAADCPDAFRSAITVALQGWHFRPLHPGAGVEERTVDEVWVWSPTIGSTATVGLGTPVVRGPLDRDKVEAIVTTSATALKTCLVTSASPGAHSRGEMTVLFDIHADGTVTNARAQGDTMNGPPLTACVLGVFSALKFPPPDTGAEVSVAYPLQFEP